MDPSSHSSRHDVEPDRQNLLALLQAQGERFMTFFEPSQIVPRKRTHQTGKTGSDAGSVVPGLSKPVSPLEREFSLRHLSANDTASSDGSQSDADRAAHTHATSPTSYRHPEVVVFARPFQTVDGLEELKRSKKAFMSAKVRKLSQGHHNSAAGLVRKGADQETEEDNQSNVANDFELHKLVYTRLVNNDERQDLNRGKHKALLGRVLEVGGEVTMGEGQFHLREKETGRAAKRVRIGLQRRMEQRQVKEEVKTSGISTTSIGRHKPSSRPRQPENKRDRGLTASVGSFSNGTLHLSKRDLEKSK